MSTLEVLLSELGIVSGLHGLVASLLPLGRTDFAILVGVLEGLDESQNLLDVASDWQVVETHLSEVAVGIDDEGGAESNTLITTMLNQAVIGFGNILADIREQWEFKVNETALLKGSLAPLHVGELGVNRAAEEDSVVGLELAGELIEGQDLSGADEGEIQRIEEEDHILSAVVVGVDRNELALVIGFSLESRGGLADDKRLVVGLHL